MERVKGITKNGYHPTGKDGGKESWRGDYKGINQVVSPPQDLIDLPPTLCFSGQLGRKGEESQRYPICKRAHVSPSRLPQRSRLLRPTT